ncbi:hypothetical protein E0Z10_g10313 [Xylaria hypoxylon]|uniref:Uncharacterized protein n=1 Tax=Xylaria hypoxylon TaxID=37992 RepID=A0A4Z0YHQ3_9PEZI|nr:hypothetical protein E0Z10_g10313 [Xylaria hypoxylon]
MSLTAAARRLLRALSLSQSAAAMMDLQRGHLARPAVDGWLWYAIRYAIDRAGTADSCSTTAWADACVELELWPSQSSISRRPPSLSSSSSSSAGQYDDDDDEFHNDKCHSTTSRRIGRKNSDRHRIDTFSSHHHMLKDSETLPSFPISPIRPIHSADSFDSIAGSARTSSLCTSSENSENKRIRNRRSNGVTSAPSIGAWGEEPATRRQRTKSSVTKSSTKKKSSNEASQACWRGYWG